ncbi:carbon-nitrogen hydrolase family protein [Polycladidibacter hongkongensis]|uniref:carbon-nitrogen hydrolase family protein n=1 Tax=Polycladidibacter hongkongensis TaxID=1647556 RepID=UPI000832E8E2|nr:carbon-nitrogen hydrolase family protein [Pseudovibrio hongkongensis]
MGKFIAACVQLRSSQQPLENLEMCKDLVEQAAARGAEYVQTPEMTNVLCRSRDEQWARASDEAQDPFLLELAGTAAKLGIWLHLGSLAVRLEGGVLANRGYMLAPDGLVHARYDKIHMFDVDLANGESWRESDSYRAGAACVTVRTPMAKFGMAICYDVRQPHLFATQARSGAHVLSAPAAFTAQTGRAHWHVLQRARAIETGSFMISSAQGGLHEDGRQTFGHSLIVDPWGRVLAEADGDDPCVVSAEIDVSMVDECRQRIPALKNARHFDLQEFHAGEPAV